MINSFAVAAAQAVAEEPGVYNPLYLYGGTEADRKKFARGLADELMKRYGGKKNTAILVEDIHLIEGDKAALERFFAVFDGMTESSAQIVISGDRPTIEFKDPELRARLEAGLIANI